MSEPNIPEWEQTVIREAAEMVEGKERALLELLREAKATSIYVERDGVRVSVTSMLPVSLVDLLGQLRVLVQ